MEPPEPTTPAPDSGLLGREQLRGLLQRALRLPSLPHELMPVLLQQPESSAELLAECFDRCEQIQERERLVELAGDLGTPAVAHLEQRLYKGSPEEAVQSVGLLARLAPSFLQQHLVPRLARWEHQRQDAAVKAIAFSGSRERTRLLEALAEHVHPYVLPVVIDEIGTAGDVHSVNWLMRLAAGEALQAADLYVRVKAIEALGRIGSRLAAPLLALLVGAKGVWRWEHPREVRICALQALAKIDPERARAVAARAGLPERELALVPLDPQPGATRVRQRRYPRFRLPEPLAMTFSWLQGTVRLAAEVLSLGGGFARPMQSAQPTQSAPLIKIPRGTTAEIEFQTLLRRVRATAVVRNKLPEGLGFELVAMDVDARTRMRQLLASVPAAAA